MPKKLCYTVIFTGPGGDDADVVRIANSEVMIREEVEAYAWRVMAKKYNEPDLDDLKLDKHLKFIFVSTRPLVRLH